MVLANVINSDLSQDRRSCICEIGSSLYEPFEKNIRHWENNQTKEIDM